MRAVDVVMGFLVMTLLLSGCVPEGPVPPSMTSTPTPTPTPSSAPAEPPARVQPWSPTCENIIPAEHVARFRGLHYQPEARTFESDRGIDSTFFANGGIFCIWTHPVYMDSPPTYGYSKISATDAHRLQQALVDTEWFVVGEFAGYQSYVLGDGYLAYLFGDGVWSAGPSTEEALLVMETVTNGQ